ncbi:sialic acid-binding Ig-like lectin 14 [Sphaerodactylus townsendi]|uniref:sialic acid-binding Ig-like lectin 14 n=1 Tax=Sphaerodactylus townsendi TaxID=933632 RepID=UPI0020268D84|nr:sialic acid-binding Ig-like lectin 14 [Sphaerodactylus townsendi]
MGRHLLQVLLPAVISALLLWEGVQCNKNRYSLEITSPVIVQAGLRVNLPCKFTYDTSRDNPRAILYGYWYVDDKQIRKPRLVATSNLERIKEISPHVRDRFELSERKLNQGDCSLTIRDVKAADEGIYHFRMEKGRKRYSYSAAKERVSVIVTVEFLKGGCC